MRAEDADEEPELDPPEGADFESAEEGEIESAGLPCSTAVLATSAGFVPAGHIRSTLSSANAGVTILALNATLSTERRNSLRASGLRKREDRTTPTLRCLVVSKNCT